MINKLFVSKYHMLHNLTSNLIIDNPAVGDIKDALAAVADAALATVADAVADTDELHIY